MNKFKEETIPFIGGLLIILFPILVIVEIGTCSPFVLKLIWINIIAIILLLILDKGIKL